MNSTHDMTDPELVWILNDSLTGILDAATWVETARELQRLGWRVVLLTTDTEEQAAGLADVEVTSLTPPSIYALRQVIFHFRAARYVLKRWREVDIVVFHHQSAFWLLPLMWGARLSGSQAPCFVMDTRTVPMTVRNLKAKLRARYEWSMYRLGRLWAHGHTAITLRMAEAVGIRGQKLWGVWPSGVNVDSFASAHANRCWPSAEQALNIIYVGTLYPERNVLMACEAVAAANPRLRH